jgi:hypothetical protein
MSLACGHPQPTQSRAPRTTQLAGSFLGPLEEPDCLVQQEELTPDPEGVTGATKDPLNFLGTCSQPQGTLLCSPHSLSLQGRKEAQSGSQSKGQGCDWRIQRVCGQRFLSLNGQDWHHQHHQVRVGLLLQPQVRVGFRLPTLIVGDEDLSHLCELHFLFSKDLMRC